MYARKIRNNAEKPLRQAILAAARDMILKDGYQNLSMRRIASAVGYSPTTLYTYFKNKNDILYIICDEIYAEMAHKLTDAINRNHAPEENIKAAMGAYVLFALENPDSYRIAFMTPADFKNAISFLEKGTNGMNAYDAILTIVKQIKDTDDEAQTLTQALWGAAHGLASNMLLHPHFPWTDRDRLIDTAADVLINGIRSRQ